MKTLKDLFECLKFFMIIVAWVSLYALSLEIIHAYKDYKVRTHSCAEPEHDANSTKEFGIAKLQKIGS